jgi:hypothetical protein
MKILPAITGIVIAASAVGVTACSSGSGNPLSDSGNTNCALQAQDQAYNFTLPDGVTEIEHGTDTVQVWNSGDSCTSWEGNLADFGQSWKPVSMDASLSGSVCRLSQNGVVLTVDGGGENDADAQQICSTKEAQGWTASNTVPSAQASARARASAQAAASASAQAQADASAEAQQQAQATQADEQAAEQELATVQGEDSVSEYAGIADAMIANYKADPTGSKNGCPVDSVNTDAITTFENDINALAADDANYSDSSDSQYPEGEVDPNGDGIATTLSDSLTSKIDAEVKHATKTVNQVLDHYNSVLDQVESEYQSTDTEGGTCSTGDWPTFTPDPNAL